MGDLHTSWFGESYTHNKFTEKDCAYIIFLMVSQEQVQSKNGQNHPKYDSSVTDV